MIKISIKTTPQRLKVINNSVPKWDIHNQSDKSIMYLVLKKLSDKSYNAIGKPSDKEFKISFYYHEAYVLYKCLLDVCNVWPTDSYERNVLLVLIGDLHAQINNWKG